MKSKSLLKNFQVFSSICRVVLLFSVSGSEGRSARTRCSASSRTCRATRPRGATCSAGWKGSARPAAAETNGEKGAKEESDVVEYICKKVESGENVARNVESGECSKVLGMAQPNCQISRSLLREKAGKSRRALRV